MLCLCQGKKIYDYYGWVSYSGEELLITAVQIHEFRLLKREIVSSLKNEPGLRHVVPHATSATEVTRG